MGSIVGPWCIVGRVALAPAVDGLVRPNVVASLGEFIGDLAGVAALVYPWGTEDRWSLRPVLHGVELKVPRRAGGPRR